MNRFASTRSEKRDSQPLPGPRAVQGRLHRGRRDPVRVHDVGLDREHDRDRAEDRDRPVDGNPPLARQAVRQHVDRVSQDAVLARLCSRRHSGDPPVIAGEKHVRHLPAAKLGGPRVVRILEPAVELRREALLDARLLAAERPGSRRAIASTSTIAGSSPPERTYGPIETASVARCSTIALVEALEPGREERQRAPLRRAPRPAPDRAGGPAASARPPGGRGRPP